MPFVCNAIANSILPDGKGDEAQETIFLIFPGGQIYDTFLLKDKFAEKCGIC